jgi:phosphoglycerate dehydrogenase-like enzyme
MKVDTPIYTLFPATTDEGRVSFASIDDMRRHLQRSFTDVVFYHCPIPPETVAALNSFGFKCPPDQGAFQVYARVPHATESTIVGAILANLNDGTVCDVPCERCLERKSSCVS